VPSRQAEADRGKHAKIIVAEGESMAAAVLGDASDTMMAHPLTLQLRNLQTLIELGVDNNTTVVSAVPLLSTIGELGDFLAREPPRPRIVTLWPALDDHPRNRSLLPIDRSTAGGSWSASTDRRDR
jgi:hypothetical protein